MHGCPSASVRRRGSPRTYIDAMELTASGSADALAQPRRLTARIDPPADRGLDARVLGRRLPRAEQRRLRHDRALAGRDRGLVDRAARRAGGRAADALRLGGLGRDRPARRIRCVDRSRRDMVRERGAQRDRARPRRDVPRRARARDRAAGPHGGAPHDQRPRVRDRLRDASGRPVAPAPAVVSRERPCRVPRRGQPRASSATR